MLEVTDAGDPVAIVLTLEGQTQSLGKVMAEQGRFEDGGEVVVVNISQLVTGEESCCQSEQLVNFPTVDLHRGEISG